MWFQIHAVYLGVEDNTGSQDVDGEGRQLIKGAWPLSFPRSDSLILSGDYGGLPRTPRSYFPQGARELGCLSTSAPCSLVESCSDGEDGTSGPSGQSRLHGQRKSSDQEVAVGSKSKTLWKSLTLAKILGHRSPPHFIRR